MAKLDFEYTTTAIIRYQPIWIWSFCDNVPVLADLTWTAAGTVFSSFQEKSRDVLQLLQYWKKVKFLCAVSKRRNG